jgi:hypothetical protein
LRKLVKVRARVGVAVEVDEIGKEVMEGHRGQRQSQDGRPGKKLQSGQDDHAQPQCPDDLEEKTIQEDHPSPGQAHHRQLEGDQEQAALCELPARPARRESPARPAPAPDQISRTWARSIEAMTMPRMRSRLGSLFSTLRPPRKHYSKRALSMKSERVPSDVTR